MEFNNINAEYPSFVILTLWANFINSIILDSLRAVLNTRLSYKHSLSEGLLFGLLLPFSSFAVMLLNHSFFVIIVKILLI